MAAFRTGSFKREGGIECRAEAGGTGAEGGEAEASEEETGTRNTYD